MRNKILLVFITSILVFNFLLYNDVISETFNHGKSEFKSPNKFFRLTIEGQCLDGFIGPQLVKLVDSTGFEYFSDSLDYIHAYPIISDSGIIAFPSLRSVNFINKYGKVIGTYTISDSSLNFYNYTAMALGLIHEYSKSGSEYYAILTTEDKKGRYLLSLTSTGKENWIFDLRNFHLEKIYIVGSYIILDNDDFVYPAYDKPQKVKISKSLIHSYLLFSKNGEFLKKFDAELCTIDLKNDLLLLYKNYSTSAYDLKNLDNNVSKAKINYIDLLHQNDELSALFSLHVIKDHQLKLNYSEKDLLKILELCGSSNHTLSMYAQLLYLEETKNK